MVYRKGWSRLYAVSWIFAIPPGSLAQYSLTLYNRSKKPFKFKLLQLFRQIERKANILNP